MPSRQPSPPPHHQTHHLMPPLAGGLTAAVSVFLLLVLCFRRIKKERTAPSASDTDSKKPPYRISYSLLRSATSKFSPSLRLGQGGFGSVYRAGFEESRNVFKCSAVPFPLSRIAVKLMDSGSLQGEREFQNELLFSSKIDCKYVVSVIGFSSNPRKRRMLLAYELMENGSLQDCLFHKKNEELKNWDKRFLIALHIAKGLEYLHHDCDPPIIHGDIKPSNILLDENFNAKIGDLGLARFKVEESNMLEVEVKKEPSLGNELEDNGSLVEETESVITASGFEEGHNVHDQAVLDRSPESVVVRAETSPEAVARKDMSPETEAAPVLFPRTVEAMASPCDGCKKISVSEGNFDRVSLESGRERNRRKKKNKSVSGKDRWWKQDNLGDMESGTVKDHVMEWIGNEIKKERPKNEWVGASSSSKVSGKIETKKKTKRRLDWWVSMDEEKTVKKEKRKPAREWWKEEYCEELERKKKKKKKQMQGSISDDSYSESWWPRDDDIYGDRKKKRSRSSMDWWLEGLSGELWKARKNSHDSVSGEIPKSGGISSTPSMRGTVCYIAPEYGGGGDISEKCDVYSYGVLLLVLIAGRRPLQVTGSPMSEFQRANLLSWARNLARNGKLIDLVDQNVELLNKDQALLCITVALLCLQKSSHHRPSMKEVVGMLSGDIDSPKLPVEYSPSPPSRHPLRSHKKVL